MFELNTNPTDRQLRQFAGLVLPLAALLIGAILWFKFHEKVPASIVLAATAGVSTLGLIRPAVLRPVYVGWMVAAWPIGWVIGHIVIGVIFFLVVTPTGLLMRMLGRDPLNRRFEPERKSYWQPRETTDDPNRHFRQF